jgi:dihydropteroate synthase
VTNRAPITAEAEIERVLPLVTRLVAAGHLVSVDTWKVPVARAALDAGAHLINDVSGLADPEIAGHCARAGAGLVIMHTRAAPKVKAFPSYDDVVADVVAFLDERIALARARGVRAEQVVIDPGPDFAKTPSQTVTVLHRLPELARIGRPILLAVSRKDFVGALTGRRPAARLAGTLAAIGEGVDAGASILRVHDVAEVIDFLTVRRALRGEAPVVTDLQLAEHLRREPTSPGSPNL